MQFRTDCVAEQWSQLKIACFVDASTEDEARACSDRDESAPTVAAEDPACVAAANGAATALANDAKATGAERDEVMARARKAVLDPCLAKPFSPELLECLRDNEENFGICGFGGGDDWEVLKASLGAAGFGPKQ
jgi:hypothetical protein